jgi:hypothetical protein
MPHDFGVGITPLSRDVLVVCVYMRALFPQVSLTSRVILAALLLLVSLSAVGNVPNPYLLCGASFSCLASLSPRGLILHLFWF